MVARGERDSQGQREVHSPWPQGGFHFSAQAAVNDGANITNSESTDFHTQSWRKTCNSVKYEQFICCKFHEYKDFFFFGLVSHFISSVVKIALPCKEGEF